MSAPKFSPEPWRIVDSAEVWSGDQPVCTIAHEENSSNLPAHEADANQRLITAAPELYDALRNLVAFADYHYENDFRLKNFLTTARAALAKVEGTSERNEL